ncbi:MAG: YHYH domain-containing protein [Bacillus sp. (in: Bacteria)]|nr:YHYH domain-containing protein [Bacillus sp. (in: firmicutes)]
MRKRITFVLLILLFLSVNTAFAHPGDTDSNGGHTCRTNCEDWGLDYGEYHYHNSSQANTNNDYDEGYGQGYDLAYSYTSECEEDYEWWWEGSQEFGDGYEQGIKDGHQEGLLVCYEDSHQEGYDKGYSNYIDDYEYDAEPDGSYDATSFEKGYVDGWAQAESEDDSDEVSEVASNNTTDDSSSDSDDYTSYEEDETTIDEDSLFDDGYDEGFEAVTNDYTFDDFKAELDKNELRIYKKGYFAGYIEGGGGEINEFIYYYFFQKYLYFTIGAGTLIIIGLVWFIRKRRQSKHSIDSSVDYQASIQKENKVAWIISGVVITSIVRLYIWQYLAF